MFVKFEFRNVSRFSCIWKKNCKDFGKNTVMCWYNIAYMVNLFIFHYIFNQSCFLLPLATHQNPLLILVQLLFSSYILVTPIQVLRESQPNRYHKFLCIFFESFRIFLLVVVYLYAHIDHGIDIHLVFGKPSKLFLRICNRPL